MSNANAYKMLLIIPAILMSGSTCFAEGYPKSEWIKSHQRAVSESLSVLHGSVRSFSNDAWTVFL